MAEPKTQIVYLDEPVKFGDKVCNEIVITEPTTGMMDRAFALSDGTISGNMKFYCSLICEVAGISKPLMQLIPYTKYKECVHYLDLFTVPTPPTGETSAGT